MRNGWSLLPFCLAFLLLSGCGKHPIVTYGDLLAKRKQVTSYKETVSILGMPSLQKVTWYQLHDGVVMKRKEVDMKSGSTIRLYDYDKMISYVYTPKNNSAYAAPIRLVSKTLESSLTSVGGVRFTPEMKSRQSTVIDGVNCWEFYIQRSVGVSEEKRSVSVRLYIDDQYGLVRKVEGNGIATQGFSPDTAVVWQMSYAQLNCVPEKELIMPKGVKVTTEAQRRQEADKWLKANIRKP